MRAISHSVLFFALLFNPLSSTYAVQTPVSIEFRNYEVINNFPQSLTFKIEICHTPENSTVYLYYKIAQSFWTYSNDRVFSDGLTEDGCQRRRTAIFTKDEPPMVNIQYYWLVRVRGGQVKSSQQEYLYKDPRFEWRDLQTKDVVVHWHDRPEEFGKKVFDIAVRSVEQQRELYGTELQYPAQIVIQNTDEEFMSWQFNPDPDTGGIAFPWYGITIQIVEDNSEDWLNDVLPHEISHLYFYQVTKHSDPLPPVWLDEGLAVYHEHSKHQVEDKLLRGAVLQDRLIPLLLLREGFGADDYQVDLAYAESYYVVVYILDVHGKEKLAQLLRQYDRGKDHNEVFMSAFNQSIDQFEYDWERWVKLRFQIDVSATAILPAPVEPSASDPAQNVLALVLLLCCFSATAGVIGLGLVLLLVKTTAKKTVS